MTSPDSKETAPEAEPAADSPPEAPETEAGADPLQALKDELAQAKDKWIRAVAEADNIRKRSLRDQEEMSKYAVSAFARDMVGVLENLKRASESIAAAGDTNKSIAEGVELTLKELLAIFEKYGIRRLDPMDEKFDHNFHQAVVQVERDDVPPGTVVQVVQAGYVIHDRLLRPAMVAVSKPADAPKKVDTTA